MGVLNRQQKLILRELENIRRREMKGDVDSRTMHDISAQLADKVGNDAKECEALITDLANRQLVEIRPLGSDQLGRPRIAKDGIDALQHWWQREKISVGASIVIGLVVGLAVIIIWELIKSILAAIPD